MPDQQGNVTSHETPLWKWSSFVYVREVTVVTPLGGKHATATAEKQVARSFLERALAAIPHCMWLAAGVSSHVHRAGFTKDSYAQNVA